ncbi:hypothetical protein CH341_12780 [Rhodoplanes roseus]|uniref:Translation initiation factor IF-2 n=1 Tax=Rhodoplanes roseus TaxID=29409 RepID=A0A327KXX4_9BRAD|nr:hypothetical protein CH341_12780 [Rhodoplanes roseus]
MRVRRAPIALLCLAAGGFTLLAGLAGPDRAAALSARVDALPGEPSGAGTPAQSPDKARTAPPKPASSRPAANPAPSKPVAKPVATPRRPIPPWIFGRGAEPRLVPPRSIPNARPGRTPPAAETPPAPAARPAAEPGRSEATGSTPGRRIPPRAPGAIDVPIAPLN